MAEDLEPLFGALAFRERPVHRPIQPQTIAPRRRTARFGRLAAMGLCGAVAFGLAIGGLIGHEVRDPIRVAAIPETPRVHYAPPQPVAFAAPAPVKLAALTPAIISAAPGADGDEAPAATIRPTPDRRECSPGSPCGRHSVMAADHALRVAYSNAIRAGVSRRDLIEMRDRWADLRASQYRRPARLYASYADLTDDLNAMSRDARSSGRY